MRWAPLALRLAAASAVLVALPACGDEVPTSSSGTGGDDDDGDGGGPPGPRPDPPMPMPTTADPDDGGVDTGDPRTCGDGEIDGGEQCDGDALGLATCALVGYSPEATGVRCTPACTLDFDACEEPRPRPDCGNGVLDPFEECDGDVGGLTCEDFGWAGGDLFCTPWCELDFGACGSICGDGRTSEGEECDGEALDPFGDPLQCQDFFGFGSQGPVGCIDCVFDFSACTECGNDVLEPGEACDGDDFGGQTCESLGLGVGELHCSFGCNLQTGACTTCGNGVIDDDEACDGTNLGGLDCEALGFGGGTLACNAGCQLDLSGCGVCGDGIAEAGEACDGADLNGATCGDVPGGLAGEVSCTPECELDGLACLMAFEGALVITEILYAPLQSPLAVPGQWFEVHNYDLDTAYSIQGCLVHSNNAGETFAIQSPVLVPPNGYAVLATPDGDADLGFVPDYAMPPGFVLLNGGDEITLECGGVVIDSVIYDDEAPWPGPPPGTAISLHPALLGAPPNDDGASWCAATTEYGIGQLGTPGGPNVCP